MSGATQTAEGWYQSYIEAHNKWRKAETECARLRADLDEAVRLLRRDKLLLWEIGHWLCENQPEDVEFNYDGDDSRSDAWGTGADCENQASRIDAFLAKQENTNDR